MAHPNRRRMLHCLRTGLMCVTNLVLVVGMSTSALSHAVRVLRDWKLVLRSRQSDVGTIVWSTRRFGIFCVCSRSPSRMPPYRPALSSANAPRQTEAAHHSQYGRVPRSVRCEPEL
ncbi:ArsR family transcriptional regulator [Rhodococcus globerulus]|uniref:ArsR family transcriptional regulator n=1 Tax=Rhodococcus globerulus TaxID=33008 RepID=UPI003557B7C7